MTGASEYSAPRGTSPATLAQQEPGAEDNQLYLNPNDPAFEFTRSWEDGKSYTLTDVRITQVSPGVFTVTSAKSAGGETAESEGEDEGEMEDAENMKGAMGAAQESDEGDQSPYGGDGYRNPAIKKMMAK